MALNVKKWITEVNTILKKLKDRGGFVGNTSTEYSLTRVNNSYVSAESLDRCKLYRTGARSGVMRINLCIDSAVIPASQTNEFKIATLPVSLNRDAYLILSPQSGSGGNLFVKVAGNELYITNYSSSAIPQSAWFRMTFGVALAYYSD